MACDTPAPAPSTAAAPSSPDLGAQVLEAVKEIKSRQEALEGQFRSIAERPNSGGRDPRAVGPFVRTGEDPNTSRGFSYLRLLGTLANQMPAEYAKVECDLVKRLRDAHDKLGYMRAQKDSVMVPFGSEYMAASHFDSSLIGETRELVRNGSAGYDPTETRALRERYWGREKALSWVSGDGSDLVAPPMMGELVDLLRNNEIFMQAGARAIGMPPNGRMVWPRQTGAATAYWVGESVTIDESSQATDELVLQAKKLACRVVIPNELFRFASVSVEQFVREDMARVMALKLDKTFLDGVGNTYEPKGLLNYSQIGNHTAATVGNDGNTFEAVDPAQMIGKVEEQNAVFNCFVMRPLMYTALSTRRASVYDGSSTVQEGPFLFNMWRTLQDEFIDPRRLTVGNLNGYPVYKSTQVANNLVKGNGTTLTYVLGGDFTDFLIALSGAMEFALATQGDTTFAKDQSVFRGILYADGAPRREASFIRCIDLLVA